MKEAHMDDRKWPAWARIALALLLLPVWAAAVLAAENDLSGFGAWFDPLMIGLMAVIVVAAWITTQHSQR
jgi:peptidoglycan/LPS O-acetylase OafA/YrhL